MTDSAQCQKHSCSRKGQLANWHPADRMDMLICFNPGWICWYVSGSCRALNGSKCDKEVTVTAYLHFLVLWRVVETHVLNIWVAC